MASTGASEITELPTSIKVEVEDGEIINESVEGVSTNTGKHEDVESKQSGPVNADMTKRPKVIYTNWQGSCRTVKERISVLCNNRSMSDVSFFVGPDKEQFYGHKFVLAMSSVYFQEKFDEPFNEDITLEEAKPHVFLSFLEHIYRDCFERTRETEETTWELLALARKFSVQSLVDRCVTHLSSLLEPRNVLSIHEESAEKQEKLLAEMTLRFVDRYFEEILLIGSFEAIKIKTLTKILQRNGLNAKETSVFNAVMRWSQAECERRGMEVHPKNQREVLKEAVLLIRFPTMAPSEFTEWTRQFVGLLTTEEIVEIYQYISSAENSKPECPFPTTPREFPREGSVTFMRFLRTDTLKRQPLSDFTHNGSFRTKLRITTDQICFLCGVRLDIPFVECQRGIIKTASVQTEINLELYEMELQVLVASGKNAILNNVRGLRTQLYIEVSRNAAPALLKPGINYQLVVNGKVALMDGNKEINDESILIGAKYGTGRRTKLSIPKVSLGSTNIEIEIDNIATGRSGHCKRCSYEMGQVAELFFSS